MKYCKKKKKEEEEENRCMMSSMLKGKIICIDRDA